MTSFARGEPVHAELQSADASTAAAVVLYNAQGAVRTLQATERLLVWSVMIASAAAVTVDVFGGTGATAAAGERIATGYMAVTSNQGTQHSGLPFACRLGVTPKVKASGAGAVTVILVGEIVKS